MILEAIFDDGTFILGERNWKTRIDECWGTHHLKVLSTNIPWLKGKEFKIEVAIPVTKPKFWVIHKNAAAL